MASTTGARAIQAKERAAEVIRLRKSGMSYNQIGKALGISEQRAWQIVDKYVKQVGKLTQVDVIDLKTLELERLDDLLQAMTPAAMRGDPKAAMVFLAISKRRSELCGLDAPKRVIEEKVDDIDEQLDRLIARARSRASGASADGCPVPGPGVPRALPGGEVPITMEADRPSGADDAARPVAVLANPGGSRLGEDPNGGRG